MKKLAYISLGVIVIITVVLVVGIESWWFQPTSQSEPVATSSTSATEEDITTVSDNLSVPWGLDFLPDGNLLVTERTGNLLEITPEGEVVANTTIPATTARGEAGLLGVAVHPDFTEKRWIYLYTTTETASGLENQVLRFTYEEDGSLASESVIISGIDGAAYHDGGRIAFGPDGYLYITTGDAGQEPAAQETDNLEGKILRIADDGTVPADNPYGPIYSYGHRNPQGLAWDEAGRVWSTEHGRSGVRSGLDEVNLIRAGGNYGWPYLEGDETCVESAIYSPAFPGDPSGCDLLPPLAHSGPEITWAPASAAVWDDSLFFGGLRGQALYEVPIIDSGEELQLGSVHTHFKGQFGRVRAVAVDPTETYLYVTTSNTDGRGQPTENDDKLLRIPLSLFR